MRCSLRRATTGPWSTTASPAACGTYGDFTTSHTCCATPARSSTSSISPGDEPKPRMENSIPGRRKRGTRFSTAVRRTRTGGAWKSCATNSPRRSASMTQAGPSSFARRSRSSRPSSLPPWGSEAATGLPGPPLNALALRSPSAYVRQSSGSRGSNQVWATISRHASGRVPSASIGRTPSDLSCGEAKRSPPPRARGAHTS